MVKSNENTCPVGEVAEEWQRLVLEWGFCEYTFFFLATLRGMQDLSSLTRDQTCAPCGRNTKS